MSCRCFTAGLELELAPKQENTVCGNKINLEFWWKKKVYGGIIKLIKIIL